MVSDVDLAGRALVTLLRQLAVAYSVVLTLSRDSPNAEAEVKTAYRKLLRKTYPDHGPTCLKELGCLIVSWYLDVAILLDTLGR